MDMPSIRRALSVSLFSACVAGGAASCTTAAGPATGDEMSGQDAEPRVLVTPPPPPVTSPEDAGRDVVAEAGQAGGAGAQNFVLRARMPSP